MPSCTHSYKLQLLNFGRLLLYDLRAYLPNITCLCAFLAGLKSEAARISGDVANPFAAIRAVVTPSVPCKAGPPLHEEVSSHAHVADS